MKKVYKKFVFLCLTFFSIQDAQSLIIHLDKIIVSLMQPGDFSGFRNMCVQENQIIEISDELSLEQEIKNKLTILKTTFPDLSLLPVHLRIFINNTEYCYDLYEGGRHRDKSAKDLKLLNFLSQAKKVTLSVSIKKDNE